MRDFFGKPSRDKKSIEMKQREIERKKKEEWRIELGTLRSEFR